MTILFRLLIDGPLLYLGLLMLVDPKAFATLARSLAQGIQNFTAQLQPFRWHNSVPEFVFSPAWSRLLGMAFVTLAMVHLIGIPHP